jgi:putative Mg2+ transporter-C (MgtC) family protein
MDSLDNYIVNWFNTGFGTNNSTLALWGNAALIFLSLFSAIVFAGLIGFEREYHGHAAGLRTHLLVALGSAIIMVVSIYGFPAEFTDHRDPARLAAQVIAGIGFLGAGTIVQTGTDIKGLTTATTIWVSMAIGLACGSGNFILGAIATLMSLICLVSMRKIEKMAAKRNPIVMVVVPSDRPVLKDILLIANRYNIVIRDTSSELVSYQENSALRITMRCNFTTQSTITAFVDEVRFTIRPLELKVSTAG